MKIFRIGSIARPLVVSLAAAALFPLCAATIVSTTGTGPGSGGNKAASWSAPATYNNVSISAGLTNFTGSNFDASFNAYLTTQIGPGTTVAHEVATALINVNLANAVVTEVPLFSGLTLNAATTYFLTLEVYPNWNGALWSWISEESLTTTLAPGVTLNLDNYGFGPSGYYPANDFSQVDISGSHVWFSVTGDLATTGSGEVPEPSSVALVATGLAAAGLRRLRRS